MLNKSIIVGVSRKAIPTYIPTAPTINLSIEERYIDGKVLPHIDIMPHELTTEQKARIAQVKELRSATGYGMMDCKKALNATDGDFEKAIEYLRNRMVFSI